MIQRDKKHRSRTAILFALSVALSTGSALACFGGFGGIVFDPTNFIENVRQAVALLGQVERATTQIRLQRRMLAELPASVADGLYQAAHGLQEQLRAGLVEAGPDEASDATPVDSLYPILHSGLVPSWLDTMRPVWTQAERTALAHERAFNARVHQEMTPTSQRLAVLTDASNGLNRSAADRPGGLATLQAQEELLALCSGEVDKLLGLRALRARRRSPPLARARTYARTSSRLISWADLRASRWPRPNTILNPPRSATSSVGSFVSFAPARSTRWSCATIGSRRMASLPATPSTQ